MTNIISSLILFIILLTNPAYASIYKLDNYIDKTCSKNCVTTTNLTDIVKYAVNNTGIDERLILAIIRIESNFNTKARNKSSKGLMQVHSKIHRKKLAGRNPYNIFVAITTGTEIFNDCYNKSKKKSLRKALECYNGGGDPNYAGKVLTVFRQIKSFYKPATERRILAHETNESKSVCLWRHWHQYSFSNYEDQGTIWEIGDSVGRYKHVESARHNYTKYAYSRRQGWFWEIQTV